MFQNMSDEQLQAHIDRCKGFNPMFANITPAQLKMMGQQMGNMGDQDLNNAKNMAQQQMGNMGGGFGQAPPQAQRPATNASSTQNDVPESCKDSFNLAKKIKDEAATEYKAKRFEEASSKYFEVLSVIREKEELRDCKSGQEIEMQARLNIALVKLQLKDWDVVIDQCERVLDNQNKPVWASGTWKAHYRMAQALYQKNENMSLDDKAIE